MTVAIITLFFATGLVCLSTDKAQNFIVQEIISKIKEQTGITIIIENFDLKFPAKVHLQNAKIDIPGYDHFLQTQTLEFDFSILKILRKQFVSKQLKIKGLNFHIHIRTDGSSNVDFFKNMQFSGNGIKYTRIKSITFEECSIRFDNDQFMEKKGEQFDPHHFFIDRFNTKIELDEYRKQTLTASIKELNFTEQKGLKVSHFESGIKFDQQQLTLPKLTLKTGNSFLKVDTIQFLFKSLKDAKKSKSNIKIKAILKPSTFFLDDFKTFSPELKNFRKSVKINGVLSGTLDSLSLDNLAINYGSNMQLKGDIHLKNMVSPILDNVYITANINRLTFSTFDVQDLIASAQKHPVIFPTEVHNLGNCNYSGTIQGFLRDVHLNGALQTNAGSIKTNLKLSAIDQFNDMHIVGAIHSKKIQLKKILPTLSIGNISFDVSTNAQFGVSKPFEGNAKAKIKELVFQDYHYKNLTLDGEFKPKFFQGNINFDDENCKLKAQGLFDWDKESPEFEFVAQVTDFAPYRMNLIKSFPNLVINLKTNADFEIDKAKYSKGFIEIFDIDLANADKKFSLENIRLSSEANNKQHSQITLQSKVINGYISGNFMFKTLKNNLLCTLQKHLPSYKIDKYPILPANDFVYKLNFAHLNKLSDFFDAKWTTNDSIEIYGSYNDLRNKINLTLSIPSIIKKGGRTSFKNLQLKFDNTSKKLGLNALATVVAPKFTTEFNSSIELNNDSMQTSVKWLSNKEKLFEGELFSLTTFYSKNDKLQAVSTVFPTQFALLDSVWNISPAKITADSSTVFIENFGISRYNQYLTINGLASKLPTDTLDVQLQNIDLSYISTFIPKASVIFGGEATGRAFVSNTFTKPIFNAQISVPEFSFNNTWWGKLDASSAWNNERKSIDLEGSVNNTQERVAHIEGGYFFRNDSLDLKGSANNLDLSFINYYLNEITLSAQGRAYGNLHVFGKKQAITVEAKAKADNAQLTVDYLNTTYNFSDSIILKPDSILFRNITISDQNKNHGKINGYVSHKYFKNFNYDINIGCDNILAMNTTLRDNPYFYGLIFATGDVKISGSDAIGTTISAQATTEPKTKVFVPISNTSTAMDNSFVVFVGDTATKQDLIVHSKPQSSNLKLLLMVEVTPDAEAQIIINPSTGDLLKATGDGSLKIEYDLNTDDFKFYGDYTLETGQYLFSLQNALHRDFRIQKGSTLRWSGRPYDADINIKATHQLTASLSEILDKSTLAKSNRTSVPVQCILNLTGNLMRPNISFDINLPNSDEELNHALKTVVNTDEMMNRQIIYLLTLGKFFAPEYLRSNTQGELLALASSTLSSQLNSWAKLLFKNWDFGINFRSTGEGDDKSNEYEFAFLYSPNDRLYINGNMGYRDNNFSASKFIGDIDAEYKITSNGKIWLKAYNHTNDYKEFKNSLTTQGIGLVYRESFNSGKTLKRDWQRTIQRNKEEYEAKKQQRKLKKEQRKAEKKAKKQTKK